MRILVHFDYNNSFTLRCQRFSVDIIFCVFEPSEHTYQHGLFQKKSAKYREIGLTNVPFCDKFTLIKGCDEDTHAWQDSQRGADFGATVL